MLIIHEAPSAEDFVRLRQVTGMSPRSVTAARKALPASLFAVHVQNDNGNAIGMGRVVGDGVLIPTPLNKRSLSEVAEYL